MAHVKEYLNKQGYDVNEKALAIMDLCDSWYSNDIIDNFHNRVTVNNVRYEMGVQALRRGRARTMQTFARW